jgi:hypothetical protein
MWTQGHHRRAPTATTPLTPTDARPTATMDLAGSQAESSLASGPGAGVDAASMVDADSTGDAATATADEATTEAGRPFPGAEDFAVGSVTATPVADVPSAEAVAVLAAVDAASVVVAVRSAEADVASAVVGVPPVAADAPSVVADVASAAADIPVVVVADTPVAEAVMVVGAGRFHQ